MPTEAQVEQSSLEEKIFPLDYGPSLLAGVTLQNVSYVHLPPTGGDTIVPTHDIDGSIASVKVP